VPYFGLRDYGYAGQIGSEGTPGEWLEALWACTAEWVRVLKPEGSLFINLGDKYSDRGHGPNRGNGTGRGPQAIHLSQTRGPQEKSLLGLPWRYAIGCMDRLGLILRAEVIWAKPNGLPESVTDRVRRAHEQVFHFTRQPRYYAAVDEIREPHTGNTHARRKDGQMSPKEIATVENGHRRGFFPEDRENPLGKLPGSVWEINEGDTLITSILRAVAAGAITIEEGERLWTGESEYGRLSIHPTAPAAGTGPASSTATDTASSGYPGPLATGEHTGSSTKPSSGPSPKGSPSTTYAGTSDASIPHTLSQSPSRRTSGDGPLPHTASTATSSHPATPTADGTGSASAGSACEPANAPTTPGSVWSIPSSPLQVPAWLGVDHFAAFPPALVRPIVLGWSPPGVCTACGQGRRPVARATIAEQRGTEQRVIPCSRDLIHRHDGRSGPRVVRSTAITGYACACPEPDAPPPWPPPDCPRCSAERIYQIGLGQFPVITGDDPTPELERADEWDRVQAIAHNHSPDPPPAPRHELPPTRPAVVLDPFGGTGTTALVASTYGRIGVTVDLSADYCRLARWRVQDPGERARARAMPKPPPIPDGMEPLFTMDGAP
jgi:hypothetical protein